MGTPLTNLSGSTASGYTREVPSGASQPGVLPPLRTGSADLYVSTAPAARCQRRCIAGGDNDERCAISLRARLAPPRAHQPYRAYSGPLATPADHLRVARRAEPMHHRKRASPMARYAGRSRHSPVTPERCGFQQIRTARFPAICGISAMSGLAPRPIRRTAMRRRAPTPSVWRSRITLRGHVLGLRHPQPSPVQGGGFPQPVRCCDKGCILTTATNL